MNNEIENLIKATEKLIENYHDEYLTANEAETIHNAKEAIEQVKNNALLGVVSGCCLPPLDLIEAESLALDTATGIEVSDKITNTEIALLYMHGYSRAKSILNNR